LGPGRTVSLKYRNTLQASHKPTSVMAISGMQVNLAEVRKGMVGHPALDIRMPVSDPEHAKTVTTLQKRPASIHSETANFASISGFSPVVTAPEY
jgi:hypothetical protein